MDSFKSPEKYTSFKERKRVIQLYKMQLDQFNLQIYASVLRIMLHADEIEFPTNKLGAHVMDMMRIASIEAADFNMRKASKKYSFSYPNLNVKYKNIKQYLINKDIKL